MCEAEMKKLQEQLDEIANEIRKEVRHRKLVGATLTMFAGLAGIVSGIYILTRK